SASALLARLRDPRRDRGRRRARAGRAASRVERAVCRADRARLDGHRRRARRARAGRARRRRRGGARSAGARRAARDDGRLPRPHARHRARRGGGRSMSARRLWVLVRREALATLRDPFTVTILVLVPLMALLLFGKILSTTISELPLGVIDGSQSAPSR